MSAHLQKLGNGVISSFNELQGAFPPVRVILIIIGTVKNPAHGRLFAGHCARPFKRSVAITFS